MPSMGMDNNVGMKNGAANITGAILLLLFRRRESHDAKEDIATQNMVAYQIGSKSPDSSGHAANHTAERHMKPRIKRMIAMIFA
jgi:hypothetical protein